MSKKNDHKQSPAAVLSSVVTEMAKPRVVESAKRVGDTLADGRDKSVNSSAKETPVPLGLNAELLESEELIPSQ
jgi:hypothetical protein